MMFYEMILWLQARMESNERGAAAVEYGMLVALIAAVIIGTVGLLGGIDTRRTQTTSRTGRRGLCKRRHYWRGHGLYSQFFY